MNIITKLLTRVNDSFSGDNWVPIEQYNDVKEDYLVSQSRYKELRKNYMNLQEGYQLLNSKYRDSKIFIEKLEEELITVNTNYSNYVGEKTKELNTLKATIESLDETVISLNSERDSLLSRIKIMNGNFKYLLEEKEKVLDESKMLRKSITSYDRLNKYLWTLLFISISGNFNQALI